MILQTVALLNLAGPDGAKAGLVVGTATSAGLIVLYLKRALDVGTVSLLDPHLFAQCTDHGKVLGGWTPLRQQLQRIQPLLHAHTVHMFRRGVCSILLLLCRG